MKSPDLSDSRQDKDSSPVSICVKYATIFIALVFSFLILFLILSRPFNNFSVPWGYRNSSHHHHKHHHTHGKTKEHSLPPRSGSKKVILISMDGFRFDYLEKVRASGKKVDNFDYLISNGVRVSSVKNAFPTITLPNHHTLVTGLYPESHGIVLNTFVDPLFPGQTFNMDNQTCLNEDGFWYKGYPEPIWVTCQRQGCLSGSVLWPMTDTPISNDLPFQQVSQFTMLDGIPARYPYKKRVDDVIWWLTNQRYSLDLILLYFDEPDETGHSYGPNSQQIIDKVVELDAYVGYLIKRLRSKGLLDSVDLIITADHGMEEISSDRVVEMDRYVDPKLYYATLLTPVAALYPIKGSENHVYESLKGADPHMKVFWKKDVPAGLHYNNSRRIAPIIGIADEGWSIVHKKSGAKPPSIGGNHGYNNSNPNMHPFFIAHGPSFKVNFKMAAMESVDVYPLMCHLLGLKPNPNNGSLQRAWPLLKPTSSFYVEVITWNLHNDFNRFTLVGILLTVFGLLIMLTSLIVRCFSTRSTSSTIQI